MKKNRILLVVLVVLSATLFLCFAGCKGKDQAKADACLKSATADMDACKKCCNDAGFSGYNWTSENCRCM